jgi:hypothetical protein
VANANWDSDEARWTVQVHRTDTDALVTISCSFLYVCTGYYRYDEGFSPKFPGVEHFRGPVIHSQHWPEDLDYRGKRVHQRQHRHAAQQADLRAVPARRQEPDSRGRRRGLPCAAAMPIPYVEAEDISNAVLYLASDESRYVTGMQLKVGGGAMVKRRPWPN